MRRERSERSLRADSVPTTSTNPRVGCTSVSQSRCPCATPTALDTKNRNTLLDTLPLEVSSAPASLNGCRWRDCQLPQVSTAAVERIVSSRKLQRLSLGFAFAGRNLFFRYRTLFYCWSMKPPLHHCSIS